MADDDTHPAAEVAVQIHVVPGFVRCPVCSAKLEVTLSPGMPARPADPTVKRGPPVPFARDPRKKS